MEAAREKSDWLILIGAHTGTGTVLTDGPGVTQGSQAVHTGARSDFDNFLMGVLAVGLAVIGQPSDLVLDGLLARLVSPLHDDLKALVVLEERAVQFSLDRATGRSTGEAGQSDFLGDAGMEF